MSTRATADYLHSIRRRKSRDSGTGAPCFEYLALSDLEWQKICNGRTPQSLPPAMIVARAVYVRERVYPWHDQVLHDYRVHFDDGTYDCISITPVMIRPMAGQYWQRCATRGDFVSWEEQPASDDASH